TLQPGVIHAVVVGPSSASAAYVAEVTPLNSGVTAGLVRSTILPERNCTDWNDVLRLQTSDSDPPIDINVRVYSTEGFPLVTSFTTTLSPGVLHGFTLGESSVDRGYLVDVTPLGAGSDGQTLQAKNVQPEFNGSTWYDVLRVQTSESDPALSVRVDVYALDGQPVVSSLSATLQSGVLHGFYLSSSSVQRGYVAEITPTANISQGFQRIVTQPESDGSTWSDVLRVQTNSGGEDLPVQIRVYGLDPSAIVAKHVTPPLASARGHAVAGATEGSLCRAGDLAGPGGLRPASAQTTGHPLAVYYAVPSDVPFDPAVLARIKRSTADIQAWYQCATGGMTWQLAFPETVLVFYGTHTRDYYVNNGNWWGSLFDEMGAAGLPIWSSGTITAVWAHGAGWWAGAAQWCGGECGMALLGVELFPEFNNPAFSGGSCPSGSGPAEWPCTPDGAFAHELGHTLGLPHPADVAELAAVANHSIMQTHWNYPDYAGIGDLPWGLLTPERQIVRGNPFMHDGVSVRQVHPDCDIVNLPASCEVPHAAFAQSNILGVNTFTAASTSSGAIAHYWTYGDFSSSQGTYGYHPYSMPGQYTVRLRVVGDNAAMDEATSVFTATFTTGVDPQASTPAVRLGAPRPNPFGGSTAIKILLAQGGVVDFAIYSVDGRRVRTLAKGYRSAGETEFHWDGLDAKGQTLPTGIYLARLKTAGKVFATKMVMAR
ncbi:MAG TPA: FlgD immunoglobulin-like domain containing protein, partial [Candidatus Eisenbacteria bacterium]|nr:FlgD immunoglobulin-like domain containing protein [Candidatus Eisenbacteria bacterium]